MSAVIIASTAAVISANSANNARKEVCRQVIDGYNSVSASIEQAQEYAKCVLFLHPETISATTTLMLRALVLSAFVGFVIGAWKSDWLLDDGFFGRLLSGFIGAISIPMAGLIAFASWHGIKFVLGQS